MVFALKKFSTPMAIVQLMRFDDDSASRLYEEGVQALKMLSRYKASIADECSDCIRKVISLLDQIFPEYADLFSDILSNASKEALLNSQTPENMLAIPVKKLTALLNRASKGRFKEENTKQLKDAASTYFGVSFAKDAFSFQIKQLIEQIFFLEKQRALEKQLGELQKNISFLLSQTNPVSLAVRVAICLNEASLLKTRNLDCCTTNHLLRSNTD